jgi:hypothetical protein
MPCPVSNFEIHRHTIRENGFPLIYHGSVRASAEALLRLRLELPDIVLVHVVRVADTLHADSPLHVLSS